MNLQLARPDGVPDVAPAGAKDVFDAAMEALKARFPLRNPRMQEAADALENGRRDVAERLASKALARRPRDAEALSIKGEIARRANRPAESERLLARCVEIEPTNELYRYNYAVSLMRRANAARLLEFLDTDLQRDPGNVLYLNLKGQFLQMLARYSDAVDCYEKLVAAAPQSIESWLAYASVLRSVGRSGDCIAALRKVTALAPAESRGWWSLAGLRVFRFKQEDIDVMEHVLAQPGLSARERANLHYALGKAYDDLKQYETSFRNYARGNAIRRMDMDYDADHATDMVRRNREVFTLEFFRGRSGAGCKSNQPIFVLGLQRAGSTLVEQILSCHSMVEAAGELQHILNLVGHDVMPKTGEDYPYGMDKLTEADRAAIGEKYLHMCSQKSWSGRPFLVDKCPFNWWHVGLIHLILPNAKIIDVRRHPIACCYANFTINFSFGPPVSYSQAEIARLYVDYVKLMAHFDMVLPGRIYRVIYERLVGDLENEVHRMLDFLELPFEPACLEYWNNERAFNSFSNEQVRSPIFKDGLDRWRKYEPWLGPMKAALGPVLEAYPDVPQFRD
jgi:tetratricopeptide (TPR) repeat protein